MLKNYINIAWKVMQRRKFFTFINLFGISFTLLILTILISIIDYKINNNSIDSNKNRSLYINYIEVFNGSRWERKSPSLYFLNKYIKTLKTPERITINSTANFSDFINGRKRMGEITFIDHEYWNFISLDFIEGSPFNIRDIENGNPVAVINAKLRNDVFGNISVSGKFIEIKEIKYRIIGVVDNIPGVSSLWVPFTTDSRVSKQISLVGSYSATLLCANKSDFKNVRNEINGIEKKVDLINTYNYQGIRILADDSIEKFVRPFGPGKEIVFTVIIIFMLLFMILPSINLVNINISRIYERASEIGVRKAFGASSLTLVQQFVIENMLFVLIGGAISFGLSSLILKMLANNMPGIQILNYRVFIYSLIVCLFFGFISGVYPAYRMSRLNVVEALKNQKI